MRLITGLARERGLAVIINIHDVPLAKMFVQRIIGLRSGEIVYDGPPDSLTPERLTDIYGAEDWGAVQMSSAEQEPNQHELLPEELLLAA